MVLVAGDDPNDWVSGAQAAHRSGRADVTCTNVGSFDSMVTYYLGLLGLVDRTTTSKAA